MRTIALFAFLLACGCSGTDGVTAQKPAVALTGKFEHGASRAAFNGTHLVPVPVLEIRRRQTLAIATVITESAEVVTTPEHPFAVTTGGWKPAGSLTANDRVVTAQGTPARVLAVQVSNVPATSVYNLGVARTHSYFVGQQSLLVHNTCGVKPILPSEIQSARSREPLQARRTAEYLLRHPKFRSLDQYTAGINLNGALRKRSTGQPLAPYEKAKLKDADEAAEVLRDAARDGHSFEGVLSRGVKHDIRSRIPADAWQRYWDLKPGDIWTTDTFLSMTADPDTATKFGTDITMRIRQWSGVPIAEISNSRHEREVLLPPGTRFRVIARQEKDGKLTLDLEELPRDDAGAGSSGSKPDEATPSPDREERDQTAAPEAQLQARLEAARKELESLSHASVGDMYQQAINNERAASLKKQITELERELAELRRRSREAQLQARLEAARKELESLSHASSGDMYQQAMNDERAATLKKQITELERELAELRPQR
jgi:hypothetical protein